MERSRDSGKNAGVDVVLRNRRGTWTQYVEGIYGKGAGANDRVNETGGLKSIRR